MTDKEDLIESAKQLKQVTKSAAAEYAEKSEFLIRRINSILSDRKDILGLIGEKNMDMMYDNHYNHARYMNSVFMQYIPEQFVETILWVFRAYRSHGFTTNYWGAQLNLWIKLIKENLSEEAAGEILPYYEWMSVDIPIFTKLSDEKLESAITRH